MPSFGEMTVFTSLFFSEIHCEHFLDVWNSLWKFTLEFFMQSKVCWSSCHGYLLATIFCPLLKDLYLAAHRSRVIGAHPNHFAYEGLVHPMTLLTCAAELLSLVGKGVLDVRRCLGKRC